MPQNILSEVKMPKWCEEREIDGHRMILCHSGRRPEPKCYVCGRPAPYLCDYVLEFGLENPTCDRPLCEQHRIKIGSGIDYCPEHGKKQLELEKACQG